MATNRWFYYPAHGKGKGPVIDGDPEDLPGFQGWGHTKIQTNTRKKRTSWGKFVYVEPLVMFEGRLYYGRLLTATKVEGAPCSTNCRQATHPFCRCSCQGKNHGIENRDMANAIQEEDVIYLG